MVPPRSDRISRVPPYSRTSHPYRIRGYHPLSPDFPDRSATDHEATGLFRVRSPLLAESLLMSFPPGTEMFQFPGFASTAYVFSGRYPLLGGLPHSDIHGSTPARGSPWLFAACHVLHRLLVPRHPPNALIALENHATPLPRGGDPSCTGTIHAPNRIPKPGNTTQTPGPDPCRRANSLLSTSHVSERIRSHRRRPPLKHEVSRPVRQTDGRAPRDAPEPDSRYQKNTPPTRRPSGQPAGAERRRAQARPTQRW